MSGSVNRDPRGSAADESLPAADAPQPPALDRLLSTVARESAIPRGVTDEFREALCEYVLALRGDGLDVVHTIIAVKAALAGVSTSLLEQSVKWTIEQYYLRALHTADASVGKPSLGGRNSPVK